MKVAFLEAFLNIRGTSVALYDYADYNELLLKNESIVITQPLEKQTNIDACADVYAKFQDRFPVFFYTCHDDIQRVLDSSRVDVLYIIKHGPRDGVHDAFAGVKTVMHSVFDPRDPHGDCFCVVSPWLNKAFGTDVPVLPHIVHLPDVGGTCLRSELGIPANAVVFGRHGGWNEFDHPVAARVVVRLAAERPNVYFVFMNTKPFGGSCSNVIFLERNSSPSYKAKFINTCDAMIYGRLRGETFGLAIGEFSIRNKPVFAPLEAPERMHQLVLGGQAYWYWSEDDLYRKMATFDPIVAKLKEWDAYKEFAPNAVMETFSKLIA
jgi:hypothetical protein